MAVIRRKTAPTQKEEIGNQEDLKKWKKIGGGPLILNNRYIKPGQVFYAFEYEIPKAFRDVVVELPFDGDGEKVKITSDVKLKKEFSLKHKGGGRYDIVDSEGKVLNETAMKKEEATEFLNTL